MKRRQLFPLILAACLASPALAFAAPKLVASTPKDGGSAARIARIELQFAAPLGAQKPDLSLVMTAMPGMKDHPHMPIKGFTTALSADAKTLTVTLPRALPMGDYYLAWKEAGAEAGRITFSAK